MTEVYLCSGALDLAALLLRCTDHVRAGLRQRQNAMIALRLFIIHFFHAGDPPGMVPGCKEVVKSPAAHEQATRETPKTRTLHTYMFAASLEKTPPQSSPS